VNGIDLKLARTSKRIKQLELARQIGISPSRLSLIENGWAKPRPEELSALRKALGLDEGEK